MDTNFFIDIIFILMISFQLSGALMLILRFCLRVKRKKIIESCFSNSEFSSVLVPDENDRYYLDVDILQKKCRDIYLTIISIIFIFLGYLLAILQPYSLFTPIINIFSVVITSVVLVLLAYSVSSIIAKLRFKNKIEISEDMIDELDIPAVCTKADIDAIFEETDFNKL